MPEDVSSLSRNRLTHLAEELASYVERVRELGPVNTIPEGTARMRRDPDGSTGRQNLFDASEALFRTFTGSDIIFGGGGDGALSAAQKWTPAEREEFAQLITIGLKVIVDLNPVQRERSPLTQEASRVQGVFTRMAAMIRPIEGRPPQR